MVWTAADGVVDDNLAEALRGLGFDTAVSRSCTEAVAAVVRERLMQWRGECQRQGIVLLLNEPASLAADRLREAVEAVQRRCPGVTVWVYAGGVLRPATAEDLRVSARASVAAGAPASEPPPPEVVVRGSGELRSMLSRAGPEREGDGPISSSALLTEEELDALFAFDEPEANS